MADIQEYLLRLDAEQGITSAEQFYAAMQRVGQMTASASGSVGGFESSLKSMASSMIGAVEVPQGLGAAVAGLDKRFKDGAQEARALGGANRGLETSLQRVGQMTASTGQSISQTEAALKSLGTQLVGTIGGFASLAAIMSTLKSGAARAEEEERANNKLWQALKLTGQAYPDLAEGAEEYARKLQALTGIDRLEIEGAIAKAQLYTGNIEISERLSKTAIALGKSQAGVKEGFTSVEESTQTLNRALTGHTTMLERAGLMTKEEAGHLKGLHSPTERAEYLMDLLAKKVGVVNVSMMTSGQRIAAQKLALADEAEELGKHTIPLHEAFNTVLLRMADNLKVVGEGIADLYLKLAGGPKTVGLAPGVAEALAAARAAGTAPKHAEQQPAGHAAMTANEEKQKGGGAAAAPAEDMSTEAQARKAINDEAIKAYTEQYTAYLKLNDAQARGQAEYVAGIAREKEAEKEQTAALERETKLTEELQAAKRKIYGTQTGPEAEEAALQKQLSTAQEMAKLQDQIADKRAKITGTGSDDARAAQALKDEAQYLDALDSSISKNQELLRVMTGQQTAAEKMLATQHAAGEQLTHVIAEQQRWSVATVASETAWSAVHTVIGRVSNTLASQILDGHVKWQKTLKEIEKSFLVLVFEAGANLAVHQAVLAVEKQIAAKNTEQATAQVVATAASAAGAGAKEAQIAPQTTVTGLAAGEAAAQVTSATASTMGVGAAVVVPVALAAVASILSAVIGAETKAAHSGADITEDWPRSRGLRSDERLVRAQVGERVQSRGEVAAARSSGGHVVGGDTMHFEIHNHGADAVDSERQAEIIAEHIRTFKRQGRYSDVFGAR